MLKDFKEEFQDSSLTSPYASERSLDLGCGGIKLNMQRTGAGNFAYVLKSADVVLMFSNHQPEAPHPNCRVEIGSMSCWSPGWKEVLNSVIRLLQVYGCTPRKQQVSEVHLTADLLGVKYADTRFENLRRWICKTPKWGMFGNDWTPNYYSRGKGNIMGRFYNKTEELAESPESAKTQFFHDLWQAHSGSPQTDVARIEFQVRREFLKSRSIDTVEQMEESLDAVWQFLTTEWCRFLDREMTESDRKNKNHQRYAVDPLWAYIQNVRFGQSRTLKLRRTKPVRHYNFDLQRRIAAGCLLTICGVKGLPPDDVEGHAAYCYNLIHYQLHENYKKDRNEYMRKVETKYNRAWMIL
jgi:hypothetical protein